MSQPAAPETTARPVPTTAPAARSRAQGPSSFRIVRIRPVASYKGGRAHTGGVAAARGAALRGVRERRPAGRGRGLRPRRLDPRLRAVAGARGEARLLALDLDVPRDRGHVSEERLGRRHPAAERPPMVSTLQARLGGGRPTEEPVSEAVSSPRDGGHRSRPRAQPGRRGTAGVGDGRGAHGDDGLLALAAHESRRRLLDRRGALGGIAHHHFTSIPHLLRRTARRPSTTCCSTYGSSGAATLSARRTRSRSSSRSPASRSRTGSGARSSGRSRVSCPRRSSRLTRS